MNFKIDLPFKNTHFVLNEKLKIQHMKKYEKALRKFVNQFSVYPLFVV